MLASGKRKLLFSMVLFGSIHSGCTLDPSADLCTQQNKPEARNAAASTCVPKAGNLGYDCNIVCDDSYELYEPLGQNRTIISCSTGQPWTPYTDCLPVTRALAQFSMKARYKPPTGQTINWNECKDVYRSQFTEGQQNSAKGRLTRLADLNWSGPDEFNTTVFVDAITTDQYLKLEGGQKDYVDISFAFVTGPPTLTDRQQEELVPLLAAVVDAAGNVVKEMVELPGTADCPALTTVHDDIDDTPTSSGPYCQEPLFLKVETDNNRCVPCPYGHYYENGDCKECAAGQYQDETAQYSCKNCKSGEWTHNTGSKDADSCLEPVITAELTEGTGTSTDKVVVEYGAETGDGVFNKYVFTINNAGNSQVEKAHDAAERKVTFDQNIEAGHTYTVTAYTVSGPVQSDSKTLTVTTNPNHPTLACGTPTETSITLIVTKPAFGGVEKYLSTCSSCGQSNTQEKDDNNGASFTYTNLERVKEYIVEVQAVFGGKVSQSVQEPCTTGEAAPEAVETFDYVEATQLPDEVTLKWTKPLVTNGIILRYELTYEAKGVQDTGSRNVSYLGTEHTFTGLKAGNEYTFTIKAWTKHKDPGNPKTVDILMPLGKPFCQENCATVQATVAETDIKSSSVRVRFRNPFSDRYGKVDRFTIIVSTTNKTKAPKDLMTWAAVKNQISGDRFYAAIWECDIFDEIEKCWDKSARKKRAVGDEIIVPVGEETCDKSKDQTFCNGPLDVDTSYFFTLRGHTVGTGDDLYQDTAVSSPVKTKESQEGSIDTTLVVGVVLTVFIVALVVLVGYLLYRNRLQQGKASSVTVPQGDRTSGTSRTLPATQSQTTIDYEDVELAQGQPNNVYETPVLYEDLDNQYAELGPS